MAKCLARLAGLGAALALAVGLLTVAAYADPLESAHYQFIESTLGNGGLIQSNSANYQSSQSVGDPVAGNSASGNYQFEAGSKTTNDPALSFSISSPNANFGSFSPSQTATATASFSVSDYTSYGYAVQLLGNAPTNGGHTISAMGTTGAPVTGTEQFGINLVANTSPVSLGANPDQGQFGAGVAASNYGTPNQYRYVSGETIATAPKSSGVTVFTISYIVNVGSLTPGGQYNSNQTVVCTGTY